MTIDLNQAPEQRDFELIPNDTIAAVHVTVRPGGEGDGGWLKKSKNGDSLALDLEFVVLDGPFAKRKFWSLFTVEGTTEGHGKASDISRGRLRGMLESAYGIKPDDKSAEAQKVRHLASWGDIDQLRCIVKIGLETGRDGYKDKNTFEAAITPNRPQWRQLEQIDVKPATITTPAAKRPRTAVPPGTKKPEWAQSLPDDDIPF